MRDDGRGEDNPSFLIGDGAWRIERDGLENFDGLSHNVSTQDYAQYDGAYLMGERTGTVDRTIQAFAVGDVAALRAEAEAFFIPGRSYEVHVEAEGRSRYAVGRQYAFRMSVDNRRHVQRITWTFLALDPMWYGEDERRFDVVEAKGKRGFPFVSFLSRVAPEPESDEGIEGAGPAGAAAEAQVDPAPEKHVKGFVAGVLSNLIEMRNSGNAAAYPRFDISATGSVVNPTVTVTDSAGEAVCEVGVDVTLQAGDELVIDFSARPTTIALNGENVSHLVTAGSTLATGIDVGTFYLGWSADSGDAALSVRPSIRERFLAI